MVLVPQLLELFWLGLEREVKRQGKDKTFDRARRVARHLPYWARRLIFRSVHSQLGGALNLMVSAGAYLPPALQQSWEDLGVIVAPGLRRDRVRPGRGNASHGPSQGQRRQAHGAGRAASSPRRRTRSSSAARPSSRATGTIPTATAAAKTDDGWYRTGDVARYDKRGNLVLVGRTKNIIVLPNGLNVYPEDIENVLSDVGLEQAVVIETKPGRLEAVVLSPDAPPVITPNSPRPPPPDDRRGEGRVARAHRADDPRGQLPPQPVPAHRRLPDLARRRLPADPHAQDQARRGPETDRLRLTRWPSSTHRERRGREESAAPVRFERVVGLDADAALAGLARLAVRRLGTIVSVPAALLVRLWTLNEPLGATVVRWPLKNALPLCFSVTFQTWPLRFESTSNSTSSRPLSGLALSFQSLLAEQLPLFVTAVPLAATAGAPAIIAPARMPVASAP